jgi:hypothetical protein
MNSESFVALLCDRQVNHFFVPVRRSFLRVAGFSSMAHTGYLFCQKAIGPSLLSTPLLP